MYEEFLASGLSDILIGSDVDFLSNDFATFEDAEGRRSSKTEKAKAQCETQLERLWVKPELEYCGKERIFTVG